MTAMNEERLRRQAVSDGAACASALGLGSHSGPSYAHETGSLLELPPNSHAGGGVAEAEPRLRLSVNG
jgi:hypothetical protein